MPIYEYECKDCGVFEVIQKFSDEPLKSCPQCKEKGKKNKVEKLMSRSSFQLVGSGWYASDYKSSTSSSPAPETKSTEKAASDTKDTSAKKDDAKPKKCGGSCSCH
jgi:putative FmdB family regulatory protein